MTELIENMTMKEVLGVEILKVTDTAFKKYGKVITGIDFSDILTAMEDTPLPEDVAYVPGLDSLEKCESAKLLENSVYGGMPIQVGYCNGNNYLLNAVEYHRDSEINIAATDAILLVGCEQDIAEDGTYDTAKIEAFLVPAGTAVEVYATTLHYAPCNVAEDGFKVVVVLPKGTNTDIAKGEAVTAEDKLLFARNKWLIAHPDAKIEGAFNGLVGENISVK